VKLKGYTEEINNLLIKYVQQITEGITAKKRTESMRSGMHEAESAIKRLKS
jgi:hypothetical protein